MKDPQQPGTSTPPTVIGEGCVSRYDLDEMDESYGTEFPEARRLWDALHPADDGKKGAPEEKPNPPSAAPID
ncbi:hypothetical protein [Pseudomonas sp. RIT-PI-AD]|uniref:hypothetical protein n=1 Tax=Pseudomonas sp. RIT-PI-AD TaxID=3035294 RepID=UPI0021DAD160|nr:hypothetical protein [Pseudomonas sp. RIT-PI-AD]